jgi:catalase
MFDAVLIPGGKDSVTTLAGIGEAVHFVLEAYKHGKTISAVNEGVQLLATLGFDTELLTNQVNTPTPGIILADASAVLDGQVTHDFITAMSFHRHWGRLHVDEIPA